MIAVVNYQAGNLGSVVKALQAAGGRVRVTASPSALRRARKIVLPGVGHFAATGFLAERGLRDALEERIAAGIPLLGICVGMQWLFAGSTEASGHPGLGAFSPTCRRFPAGRKIPHVGWNSLTLRGTSRLFAGVPDGSYVYFTHSWRAPLTASTVAVCEYGGRFTAAVERGALFGVQFHPEKSGAVGLRLLRNFVELAC